MNLQLDDRESASADLCFVLRCNSSIFDSRVHKNALQRLISIQNEFSPPRVYWRESEVCLRYIGLKILQVVCSGGAIGQSSTKWDESPEPTPAASDQKLKAALPNDILNELKEVETSKCQIM